MLRTKLDDAPSTSVTPDQAAQLLRNGCAPAGLVVEGVLKMSSSQPVQLPERLAVNDLDLSECTWLTELPVGLQARHLNLSKCSRLTSLPRGLHCYELNLQETPLTELPDDLRVDFKLDLENCSRLRRLPQGLTVGSLVLSGCTALNSLPEGLNVYFLDISRCSELHEWPDRASLRLGRLRASNCTGITTLPGWLTQLAQLDVSGCANLRSLPEDLQVTSWLDLAGTSLVRLPDSLHDTPLCWRGVPIDRRIAFHPEEITSEEILAESNIELRRVKLERMGFDRFLRQADAEVLDTDRDAGGERRLLRVRMENDEDLVCVSVFCPSTDRQYIIRVPPDMETCREAVAWTAGFDDPDDYRPLMET